MRLLILLSVAISLGGCATRTGLPSMVDQDTYCRIARPITWSPSDTRVTKEQVDAHNRTYKRLCMGGKK